jgi:hypothetical protein
MCAVCAARMRNHSQKIRVPPELPSQSETFEGCAPNAERDLSTTRDEGDRSRWYVAELVLSKVASTLWGTVLVAQVQVYSQHVNHLFAKQSLHRCVRVSLKDLIDLSADLGWVALEVRCPL